MHKKSLIFALSFMFIAGCEEIMPSDDYGYKCPKNGDGTLSYVSIDGIKCYASGCPDCRSDVQREKCSKYYELGVFSFQVCPDEYPTCNGVADAEKAYYCYKPCDGDKLECDGFCLDASAHYKSCSGGKLECAAGYLDCNNYVGDGCEVSQMVLNIESCNDGQITCKDGFADCDGELSNGCEVKISESQEHCGACNHSCAVGDDGKYTQTCDSGTCVSISCPPNMTRGNSGCVCDAGFADCDADSSNGCELNLSITHTLACSGGVLYCESGYANCDNVNVNGCEQSITSDEDNCGACGTACSQSAGWKLGACENGKCRASDCSKGYFLEGAVCTESSTQNCAGVDCTEKTGWQAGACNNNACVISECKPGFYLDNGECKASDAQHCGSATNDCTSLPGWNTGDCINGVCKPTSCKTPYSLHTQTDNSVICDYQIGDIITFGSYEQDANPANGKEPIEWRILDKDRNGTKVLLISDKVLDAKAYNETTTSISITWEKSTLRSWLNGYDMNSNANAIDYSNDNFMQTAFTTEERARIVKSSVLAEAIPVENVDKGNDTEDYLFLLSRQEVISYFKDENARQCIPTQTAINNKVYIKSASNTDWKIGNPTDKDCSDNLCTAFWWQRTHRGIFKENEKEIDIAYSVSPVGAFQVIRVSATDPGIRPALWLKLD